MSKGQRFAFLDAARGIAVLWMIQVHVTNVVLDPALRSSWWFTILNISNGYVAPTFIFCAGSGLWIALSRRGENYLEASTELRDYLKRLSYVLFCAYVMHTPVMSLRRMLDGPAQVWTSWLQLDVLHVIVYASLAALAVFFVVRNLHRATIAYGVIAAVIMAVSWSIPRDGISQFPLLPWSGYLFAGAAITGWFMRSENKERLARLFVIVGLIGPVVLFIGKGLSIAMPWDAIWWRSPGGLLFRVCATLLLLGSLFHLEQRLTTTRVGRLLVTLGNESLFMYISHLLLVYGSLVPWLDQLIGTHYVGPSATFLMWIAVSVIFTALMFAWRWVKQERPDSASWVLRLQVGGIIAAFLLLP
ncbi:MAG: heparan-alpha-glucosaminide N-acetyltransferase domain-containing protein [Candidatus Kapaibacterium sp.]